MHVGMRGTMYIKEYGQPGQPLSDAQSRMQVTVMSVVSETMVFNSASKNMVLLYTADRLKSPISQRLAGSSILQIPPSDPNRLISLVHYHGKNTDVDKHSTTHGRGYSVCVIK